MKMLMRILAMVLASVVSVLAVQYVLRRFYLSRCRHSWHGRDWTLEDGCDDE
jgi:hypothetical protein